MARSRTRMVVKFPEEIIRFARESHKRILDEKEQEEVKRRAREEENSRIRCERLKNGLRYAKKVFEWAEDFKKSRVGQELMEISHLPSATKNVFFFDGNIAGVNWLGLAITPKGLLLVTGGRCRTEKHVESAPDLAASVDTKILQAACKWIKNGRVWECIKDRFRYLEEKT